MKEVHTMALTPEDVRNKQFTTVRFKEGYDLDEVDNFLDDIEVALAEATKELADLRATAKGEVPESIRQEIRDLGDENAQLKSELEEAKKAAVAAEARVESLQSAASDSGDEAAALAAVTALEADKAELVARIEELTAENAELAEAASSAAAPVVTEVSAADQGVASVRILELAQRTADEAVASARIESEQLMSKAQAASEELVSEAKTNVANITREFESQRVAMERRVEELRAYEREYRSRLLSYLEGQLRELETKNINEERQVTGE
jgi:DivIVA domain-containing protein